MTVLKVDFVGIRTDRLDETVALFRDVLGVSVTRQTGDLVGFRLADGTVLEISGAGQKPDA
jgi:catechol 2,3-dioxygenase-like lactoylglutathione lyase family enzyme